MKRTSLMLDDRLLREAAHVLGEKTYSAAVNRALKEAIQLAKVRRLNDFVGSGIWEGDLSVMREDRKR